MAISMLLNILISRVFTVLCVVFSFERRTLFAIASNDENFLSISKFNSYNHTARQLATEPSDNVAICSLFLDEDANLVEWMEYHLMIGVSKIFLYHLDNHAHKNRWRHILWPYVSKGQVELHAQILTYLGQWSNRQVASLQHCYDTYRHDYHWIAFIDIDEFIVPRNAEANLPSLLTAYTNASGLVMPWRSFGPVVEYNNAHGELPRITEATNATVFDYREGIAGRLAGTIKTIVNTRFTSGNHCTFVYDGFDGRFRGYPHNCLYRSQSPPVDELFRPVTSPWGITHQWLLAYPASSNLIQLNHYFARTCSHFFGVKRKARLAGRRAQYGQNIPEWELNRLSMGMSEMNDENCRKLGSYFQVPDTAILEIGQKLWAKLDSMKRIKHFHPQHNAIVRKLCDSCLPNAHCVDLLQESANHKQIECVCPQPLIGDARRFCGSVIWAARVITPDKRSYRHMVSAPDGNLYSPNWKTDPQSSEYRVFFFGKNDANHSSVRMILIYQPFTSIQIKSLSYTHAGRRELGKESISIDLSNIQSPNRTNPPFMMIPVGDITLTSVFIRFDVPVLLGGAGIVIT